MSEGKRPQRPEKAHSLFQPRQLTKARELRGLTRAALSEKIHKTPGAISQFESGLTRPDTATIARLALVLHVPVPFFSRAQLNSDINLSECHFRSLRSASQYHRRQAVRFGELLRDLSVVLESRGIVFPIERLSALKSAVKSVEEIEQLADNVRDAWGLRFGPIPNPIALLEAYGVRILPLTGSCSSVDSFSVWSDGVPFVFLATSKSPSRVHFDAAHELGHLLMHDDVDPGSHETESAAHRFASAFLLPSSTFSAECPRRWTLREFSVLKHRWFVSIQAMVRRGFDLGVLGYPTYKRAYSDLNRLRLRKNEGDEWNLSPPEVLRRALELEGGLSSLPELAGEIGISAEAVLDAVAPLFDSGHWNASQS